MYGHNRLLTFNYSPGSVVLSDAVLNYPTISSGKFHNIYVNGTNIRTSGGASIWKIPVSIVSSTNVSLSGPYNSDPDTIDKRILLTNQNDPIQNGIYVVSTGNWQRAVDLLDGDSASGIFVLYTVSTNNYFTYQCTNDVPDDIVGTNNIFFEEKIVGYPAGGTLGETQRYDISPDPFFGGDQNLVYSIDDTESIATLALGGQNFDANIITNRLTGIPYILRSAKNLYFVINVPTTLGGLTMSGNTIDITCDGDVEISNTELLNITFDNINITSNSAFEIYNGNIKCCSIDDNGISLIKSTYSSSEININVNALQGTIILTDLIIDPNNSRSRTIIIDNTNLDIDAMVFVKLLDYEGSGDPYIKVNAINQNSFDVLIYNLDQTDATNENIKFTYNIL